MCATTTYESSIYGHKQQVTCQKELVPGEERANKPRGCCPVQKHWKAPQTRQGNGSAGLHSDTRPIRSNRKGIKQRCREMPRRAKMNRVHSKAGGKAQNHDGEAETNGRNDAKQRRAKSRVQSQRASRKKGEGSGIQDETSEKDAQGSQDSCGPGIKTKMQQRPKVICG